MTTTLCNCGHTAESDGMTTGYGTDRQGRTLCFACCGENDKAEMIATGKATLYLTKKDGHWRVVNWPSTLVFQPFLVRGGRHNMAGSRTDVWFNGPDGKGWHGVQYGENSQLCHCKRIAR